MKYTMRGYLFDKQTGEPLPLLPGIIVSGYDEAFALIKELPLNFIGNVEGYDLVMGQADVIVSDGFSGNCQCNSRNHYSVGAYTDYRYGIREG